MATDDRKWRQKAHDARRTHAQGMGVTAADLESLGWHIDRMVHDMRHAWDNECPDCHRRYQDMPNGMADLTVDRIYPTEPPYWGLNTRICCATDNKKKGPMSIAAYGERRNGNGQTTASTQQLGLF